MGFDEVFARTGPGGEVVTYISDIQGTVIALADEGGRPATSYSYTPHGQRRVDGNPDANPFGFTGREHDPTDLVFYRARYYHPELGRFISEDPLGYAAGDLNLYNHTYGDPVNFTDPTGMQPVEAVETAGVGVCVSTVLYAFNEAANMGLEAIRAIEDRTAGLLTHEDLMLLLDRTYYRTNDLIELIATICGVTLTAVGLAPLGAAGGARAIGAFGRGAQRLRTGATTRFPGLTQRVPALNPKPTSASARPTTWADALPNPYAGVRDASRLLQEAGVPRRYRIDVLQSFEIGTINVRRAGNADYGIRYYDVINAHQRGRYLTSTLPATRAELAVWPSWNQFSHIQQWRIRPGTTIIEGRIAPQGVGYPGGARQIYVIDPKDDLLLP